MPIQHNRLNWPTLPEAPQQDTSTSPSDAASAAIRGAAGGAVPVVKSALLPWLVRTGSGLGAGVASIEPGLGSLIGAGLAGGGETIAQLMENGFDTSKINKRRVAAESALGAIPFGGEGGFLKNAVKGAGLALAGIAGRKWSSENPDEQKTWDDPTKWGQSEAIQTAIGAGTAGILGKLGAKSKAPEVPPVAAVPLGPEEAALQGFQNSLKTVKQWKPDKIKDEAARLDAMGYTDAAHKLRVAALDAGVGDREIYETISKNKQAAAQQTGRNANAAATAGPLPTIEEALARGPKAVEELALRAEALGQHDYANELRQSAIKAGANNATTARAVIRGTKAEQTAAEKAALEASKAQEVARRRAWLGDNVDQNISYRDTVSAQTPEGGRESASISLRPKKAEPQDSGGAPVPTAPKVPPKPGLYQVVKPDGTIAGEFESPDDVNRVLELLGPNNGHTVVEPADVVKPPKVTPPVTPEPFNPPRIRPESTPLQQELAAKTLQDADKLRGTPEDVPANPVAQQLEAERQALAAQAKVEPSTAEALKKGFKKKAAVQATIPEQGVVPVIHSADLPTPQGPRLESTHPLDDIAERAIVRNPQTGVVEPAPGDVSLPTKTLVLEPKTPYGGWFRKEITPEGIKASETKGIKPYHDGRFDNPALTADETAQLHSELEGGDYSPLSKELLERGRQPAADQSTINTTLTPETPEVLAVRAKAQEFAQRRADAMRGAQSEEEAQAIGQSFSREANDLALEMAKAERAAELGARGKGGSSVGFMGITPDILDAIKRNPRFAGQLAGGVAGAAIGGHVDKKDPLGGAILGGMVGAGGATALSHMSPSVLQPTGAPLSIMDRAANWQRFALLSNLYNLGVNTGAPVASSAGSALEKILAGRLAKSPLVQQLSESMGRDAGDPSLQQLGQQGLRELVTPSNYSPAALRHYLEEAKMRIHEADIHQRADMIGGDPTLADTAMKVPAFFMTAGDEGARDITGKAGWSEPMARVATLTNDARYKDGEAIVNAVRSGGPLTKLMLPFVKTNINAIEGSVERIPIFGLLAQASDTDPNMKASISELMARQGGGMVASGIAYQLGKMVDPETSKKWKLPMVIANMGGQYGPLMAAVYTYSQAAAQGQQNPEDAGLAHALNDMPLPTTELLKQIGHVAVSYAKGEAPYPNKDYAIQRWFPNNLIPRFLSQDNLDSLNESLQPTVGRLNWPR